MLQHHIEQYSVIDNQRLVVTLASTQAEIEDAQRLRYEIFALEMGAKIDSVNGLDIDKYDEYCQHLIVKDEDNGRVVGCYRLLTIEGARKVGGWYSAGEFDLSRIEHILDRTVELGRACVHKDYRNGGVVMLLWTGLIKFMQLENLSYMIGCGSISMNDGGHMAASLYRKLEKKYLSPLEYRVFPHIPVQLETLKQDLEVSPPALIKGYLRAGAYICGEPAWDPDFNSADVLIMMPITRLDARYLKHFCRESSI